ncbi:pyrophosphatase PpaX [Paenibacillus sp. JX-17]|uniref:Pyrophosphatase PpaX n=1 Tax=Paenibacillus lacisoli TaxID=3064525 RepID=A0ABT9CIY4_9BACL|nr:pyrophosphatase PpaX [Paenibacillus sp. JX-17]MDO7908498.1 pyrophosphatase PpaX [Paenibacillus sp. JX-17]
MITTVLFDLDGTIIDTNELIISSFINSLHSRLPKPLTREEIIPHMGDTLEKQLQQFAGEGHNVEEMVQAYRAYNALHHDEMVKTFPHVPEVVKELHKRGIKLGVVTTKIRPSSMRVLNTFGLTEYMGSIVTVNDVVHPKPHAEPVLKAVEELQADPDTTLMVGDSSFDILAAKAAGVQSAGVAWSLKGEETLRRYEPDFMLYDMRDILDLVSREND